MAGIFFLKHHRIINITNFENLKLIVTRIPRLRVTPKVNKNICPAVNELKHFIFVNTCNVQLKLNGEIYRRIEEEAMGSPTGPLSVGYSIAKIEISKLGSLEGI